MASSAKLIWKKAEGEEQPFDLAEPVTTIGRGEESDIRLTESLVSRNHARIERRDGVFYVQDIGSTNWTRVNDEVVSERALVDGDEVRFGRAVCLFRLVSDKP